MREVEERLWDAESRCRQLSLERDALQASAYHPSSRGAMPAHLNGSRDPQAPPDTDRAGAGIGAGAADEQPEALDALFDGEHLQQRAPLERLSQRTALSRS